MKRFLILLLLPLSALSQIPEKQPNTYVNDYTNTLTLDEIKELNDSIQALENRTSVEIAIVLINHTDMDIADYALQLGRSWHVGNAGNGIVYVAALDDHKQRLETGSRVEGNIPDAEALAITNEIKPWFRNKDYGGGLLKLIDGIKERIDPAYAEQLQNLKEQRAKDRQKQNEIVEQIFMYMAFAGVGFFIIWFFFLRPYWRRKREEREKEEEEAERLRQQQYETYNNRRYKETLIPGGLSASPPPPPAPKKSEDNYIPPPVYVAPPSSNDDSYSSRSSSNDDNNSFNFGGNDSFSGGGATNDW